MLFQINWNILPAPKKYKMLTAIKLILKGQHAESWKWMMLWWLDHTYKWFCQWVSKCYPTSCIGFLWVKHLTLQRPKRKAVQAYLMFLVSLLFGGKMFRLASFQCHPHKAATLLCHVDGGKSLVHAGRLSSGTSLSWNDKGDLYTSASMMKFSAGQRMSQFSIKSDGRHILLEEKSTLSYTYTLGCTRGIRKPLHMKCQCSSSYYVYKNRCTVERAGLTVALPILCCSLHYWTERWAMLNSHTCKVDSTNSS